MNHRPELGGGVHLIGDFLEAHGFLDRLGEAELDAQEPPADGFEPFDDPSNLFAGFGQKVPRRYRQFVFLATLLPESADLRFPSAQT